MSTLYLVRHGQASFGEANYDRLSPLGEKQSQLLGEYWVRTGVSVDAVYIGSLERQRRSAEFAARAFRSAGRPFPEPAILPEFNEYDTQSILTGSVPEVLARHPDIVELYRELAPEGKPDLVGNRKTFQRLFARVMDLWVSGRLDDVVKEPWKQFTLRVNRGLDRVMAENNSGKTVAVFTSGGPISAAMQRALVTPDKVTMDLGWAIVNGSITEFRYSGDKFSLVSFNAAPHLSDPELITLR